LVASWTAKSFFLLRRATSVSGRRDKNVIVLRSDRFKTSTNGARPDRCNSLTGIVESKVFITSLKGWVFSGTRGREFEPPQARHISLCFELTASIREVGESSKKPRRDRNVIVLRSNRCRTRTNPSNLRRRTIVAQLPVSVAIWSRLIRKGIR
jgi:hypothetical protein